MQGQDRRHMGEGERSERERGEEVREDIGSGRDSIEGSDFQSFCRGKRFIIIYVCMYVCD